MHGDIFYPTAWLRWIVDTDVGMTLGFFALTQLEFDLNIVAAILTIVGYSLNDTIVVFDKVQDNT